MKLIYSHLGITFYVIYISVIFIISKFNKIKFNKLLIYTLFTLPLTSIIILIVNSLIIYNDKNTGLFVAYSIIEMDIYMIITLFCLLVYFYIKK